MPVSTRRLDVLFEDSPTKDDPPFDTEWLGPYEGETLALCPLCSHTVVLSDYVGSPVAYCLACGFEGGIEEFEVLK